MRHPGQQFIPVGGDEALIVIRYRERMAELRQKQAKGDGIISPLIHWETEEDCLLHEQYCALAKQKQMEYNLEYRPILVPVLPPTEYYQAPSQLPARIPFYECKHDKPTDFELARHFICQQHVRTRNGSVYLYNYNYNGKYYQKLSDDQLKSQILSILRSELEVKGNSKQLDTVAAAIKAEPTIQISDENLPSRGLCLKNCVIEIDSMRCADHNPQYFFTIQLQVDYQGPQPTPVMDRFLYQIAGGDPVLIKRIWQVIAYCLVPQDNRAKRFFLFQGLGNTGKSVLGSLIASFYEESDVGSVDAFKIGDRFSLSALANKAVNISMDLSSASLGDQAVGIIKQMTGNDLVQVEEKYRTPYATRVGCKLIFGTNHQLRTATLDAAFLRRICLIPFNYPVPKYQRDHYLLDKLKLEKACIFFKAMEAYRELVANNYTFAGDDVYDMVSTKQAGEQLIDYDANIEVFIAHHIAVMPGSFVPTKEIHQLYITENTDGLADCQKFSTKFKLLATKHGLAITNKKKRVAGESTNGYEGIALV